MLKNEIDQFLAEKRLGFVGVSRVNAKYSNTVYRKLKESGYDVHPVHLEMESIDGDRCVQNVQQLPGEVQTLMIIASPKVCASVLRDVSGTNISRIWIFSGKGIQPDIEAEIQRLRDTGVSVISGFCPFMFLEPVASVHSIHRFIVRLIGKYPK